MTKPKTQIMTKLKTSNYDLIPKINFGQKKNSFLVGQYDTLTTDEMYSGQPFAILRYFGENFLSYLIN